MTHGDLHMAVRQLVGGRGIFVVTVQSTEHHPGRIEVLWSVCVLLHGGAPNIVARSMSPSSVLQQLEHQMERAVPSLLPPELRAIGEPPTSIDEATVPTVGSSLPHRGLAKRAEENEREGSEHDEDDA